MKTFLATCISMLAIAAPLSAADLVWVTFHGADDLGNTPSAGAAGAGHTVAPDKAYTDLLLGVGHTINRVTVPAPGANVALSPALLAELNAADLVIVGRSVNSGSFEQAAETMSWNGDITAPVLMTSGYIIRDNRLAYATGNTIPDITGPTRLVANAPTHPVFSGITLNASNETGTILDIVDFNGTPQRGTSIVTFPIVPGGTLIASVTSDNPAAANGPVIAEWEAGTPTGNAGETMASKRMIFITGSREVDGVSGDTAGILDLSTVGQQMFLNAVAYIGAPPPIIVKGDTDGDGVVELEDFNPIRDNFRKNVTLRTDGDLVNDDVVNFLDFREWKTAFLGGGGSLAGLDLSLVSNVPEPSSVALILCPMMMVVLPQRLRS